VVCWHDDEKQAITCIGHETAEIQDVTLNVLVEYFLIESLLLLPGIFRRCCRLKVNILANIYTLF
jgi:hypothetical protein